MLLRDDPVSTEAIRLARTGYGVDPCSKCGGRLLPGQPQETMPGVWRTYHVECPVNPCSLCGDPNHTEGMCLL